MTARLSSPQGMLEHTPYHHVAVATGTTHVHVAGQVGQAGNDPVATDDLAAQVAQALRNTAHVNAGAAPTYPEVDRLPLNVTRWGPQKM